MNRQQPQTQQPLMQRIEAMQMLALYPALTVMVFLRRGLGYRLLNPLHLSAMAAVLFLAAGLSTRNDNSLPLALFAGLMLTTGLVLRVRGWITLRRGIVNHSYYMGDSHLHALPLPQFARRCRRLERFADPLLCFVCGVWLTGILPALGFWLAFAGFSLRAFENGIWRKRVHRELDILDGLIVSDIQSGTVSRYINSQGGTAGDGQHAESVPTGMSEDLKARLERKPRTQKEGKRRP